MDVRVSFGQDERGGNRAPAQRAWIASPGVYDHERNLHRSTAVWTLRTVTAILTNPRYTGRQVWSRQCTDHREAVPGDRRSSRGPGAGVEPAIGLGDLRRPDASALVSDADFLAVQRITALAVPADGRATDAGTATPPRI